MNIFKSPEVFDKVREDLYQRKMLFWKILSFQAVLGILQHFDGESAKIYTREIRRFYLREN